VTVDSPGDRTSDGLQDVASDRTLDSPGDATDAADVVVFDSPGSDCGSTPVQHDDGVGQMFSDNECAIDEQLALDACAAFTGDPSQCHANSMPCSGDYIVCSFFSPIDCVCWAYMGPDAGRVHDAHQSAADAGGQCTCVSSGDPMYH